MPLAVGTRLGAYEVTAAIGAGGMGEVYRARDSRLNRDVAIKSLPAAVAADAERLARFRREAQVLASLNHPNIAGVYGLEEAAGELFLVMEFVEGEDLAARLRRGALAFDEAIAAARQVAEALEEAHEKGIVHRDLKPANVKITPDGKVKVLDFGLAKAMDRAGADASPGDDGARPTMTSPAMTEQGVILGTAAYMSPEQAKGRPVDRRADIWAFGVVLREMLTGRTLFARESVAETLGAIFQQPIPVDDLPAGVPPAVRHLLARCLDRDPRTRLRDIGEARVLLASPEALAPAASQAMTAASRSRIVPLLAATAVVATAVAGWALLQRPTAEAPVRKLDVIAAGLQTGLAPNISPVLSPDGARLLFVAGNRLWVRRLDRLDAEPVSGSDGAAYFAWAPDSRAFAFVRGEQLWVVPAEGGGNPTAIGPVPQDFGGSGGIAWNDRGEIALTGGPEHGLVIQPARGGASRVALALDKTAESDFHEVSALPGARGWLFTVHRLPGTDTIAVLAGGVRRDVLQVPGETLRSPLYSPTGHMLYHRTQTNPGLWAVRFSLDRLEVDGTPFLVAADASQPSVSSDGTLAFVRKPEASRQFAWVSRTGVVERFGPAMSILTRTEQREFRLSPDGRFVSYVIWDGSPPDVWTYDVTRGAVTRLTTQAGASAPVWTGDGRRVLFAAFIGERLWNIYARHADATGDVEPVVRSEDFKIPLDVSGDGRWFLYAQGPATFTRLWAMRLDERGPAEALSTPPAGHAALSPDARWLAYVANDSGRPEVYVQPFPSGSGRWPVSTDGGTFPMWSRDGREVIFRSGDRIMTAAVNAAGERLDVGASHVLFQAGVDTGLAESFDVAADGRLLMVHTSGQDRITIVLNLAAELARLEGRGATR